MCGTGTGNAVNNLTRRVDNNPHAICRITLIVNPNIDVKGSYVDKAAVTSIRVRRERQGTSYQRFNIGVRRKLSETPMPDFQNGNSSYPVLLQAYRSSERCGMNTLRPSTTAMERLPFTNEEADIFGNCAAMLSLLSTMIGMP